MRTRVITVTLDTWAEHAQAGIAAINEPGDPTIRPKVMAEIAGIRSGDALFFYIQRTKEIFGGFRATIEPFYDNSYIVPGGTQVDSRFPYRIGFQGIDRFARPIHVNEIWAGRDAGQIWTMQQARGDAIGRHACWGLSKREGRLLDRMLRELNTVIGGAEHIFPPPQVRERLPFNVAIKGQRFPSLRYEGTLQALTMDRMWGMMHAVELPSNPGASRYNGNIPLSRNGLLWTASTLARKRLIPGKVAVIIEGGDLPSVLS